MSLKEKYNHLIQLKQEKVDKYERLANMTKSAPKKKQYLFNARRYRNFIRNYEIELKYLEDQCQ